MTTERNIIIYAGQTFELSLDYAGTVGRGQRMHIRSSDAAADVIAILTHNGDANARVIYDGTDSIDITIGASVNGGWLVGANRVEWVYDIEDYDLSDADDLVIPYRGKVIAYGNRTRPEDVTPSAALPSGDGRYVRFDGVQGLTDAQKLQARENIGADTGGGGSGDDGWSPILAVVNDGARRVHQVADWTGGAGTKPATGGYIGASGIVALIGDAVDIRGAEGAAGPTGPTGPTGPVSLASTSTTEAWASTTEAMTPGGTKNAAPPYVEWGASADKTLALTDANVDQWCNNGATARVLNIPANSSVAFSVGAKIPVLRLGSGTCTIDAATGVTLNGVSGGSCTISTQYQGALLAKTGTDAWVVSGDVSAVA